MDFSDQELEAYTACFILRANGCKTSREIEHGLYSRLWWITKLEAERYVRQWIHTFVKIDPSTRYMLKVPYTCNQNVLTECR